MIEPAQQSARLQRLASELDRVLDSLDAAPAFAKIRYQEEVFALASDLMDSDEGVAALLERAPRFDATGVFHAGPWEDPSRLVPSLVGMSLKGEGVYPTVEALSSLRILALASGRASSPKMDAASAREFLGEAGARNLELLLPATSEEARRRPKIFGRARRLFERILDEVPTDKLLGRVVEEIDLLAAQRPIRTGEIEALVRRADQLRSLGAESADAALADDATSARLDRYLSAMGAATERSRAAADPIDYRKSLLSLDTEALVEEAREFAVLLQETGLANPYHAVVLRRVAVHDAGRVGEALGTSDSGIAESGRCAELVQLLVGHAIVPDTRFALLGLAKVLERGVLSRDEVAGGLRKIVDLPVRPDVTEALLASYDEASGLTANDVLLAGCLGVLGLPLGIGQGNNPTCQSARGISLWSLHAPGQLLAQVASVARDGFYETTFEGQPIRSDGLAHGVAAGGVDLDLDPVSQVLVPHMDRVYNHMMMLAALRGDDGHRWVNPALYGHWISTGFATVFALGTSIVHRHETFVRRFYATHHPEHNDGHELIYPNPVGIMVTDSHARLLGRHAVSVQRIAPDPSGGTLGGDPYRVYFFNPNNEGRQDWGAGVRPTVAGHGERPGESSLPFAHFTSRLYAFHFNPQEEGDAFAVPGHFVDDVVRTAAESWGASLAVSA